MRLTIYKDDAGSLITVGTLETLPGVEEQFAYAPEYLASIHAQPISQSLPLGPEVYPSSKVRPYFEGLLPEGQARVAIARKLGVRNTSYLKILAEVGLECIGDIVIAKEDIKINRMEPAYEPLSLAQLRQYADHGAEAAPELQAATRLSLAGAQMKTGLYHRSDESLSKGWYIPKNSAPSTHIIKFSSTVYKDLVLNEYLCMETARTCGVSVPPVALLLTQSPTLCIQRYDRVIYSDDCRFASGQKVPVRLHQEDLAQAFGVLPEKKYDGHLWDGYRGIAAFLVQSSKDPARNLTELVKVILFNYLIGNCDNHLKNYSLLYSSNWSAFALAPSYDLVSTIYYERLERTMAMKIGSHSHIDSITSDDFTQLAEQLGVSRKLIRAEGQKIAERLIRSIEESTLTLTAAMKTDAARIASEICRSALPRIKVIQEL